MSSIDYGGQARMLQDRFDTRRLADALNDIVVHDELSDADRAFIGTRDMFWLATVDAQGEPTVSYKGGATGFVGMPDSRTLMFPCYDGNGMFYSMGNIGETAKVALLFMDFEHPHRIRVQGEARLSDDSTLLKSYPGALLVISIAIRCIFQNCPRYIHRMVRTSASRYVPAKDGSAPVAGWKRIDAVQPVLPASDRDRVDAAGGLITGEAYAEMVRSGDPMA